MNPQPTVYILSNQKRGALYIGVTRWPIQRIGQHRAGLFDGFTEHYNTRYLVHLETTETILDAIAREKQLKNWTRAWKIALIERDNPTWRDLAIDLGFEPLIPPRHVRRNS